MGEPKKWLVPLSDMIKKKEGKKEWILKVNCHWKIWEGWWLRGEIRFDHTEIIGTFWEKKLCGVIMKKYPNSLDSEWASSLVSRRQGSNRVVCEDDELHLYIPPSKYSVNSYWINEGLIIYFRKSPFISAY